MNCHIFIVNFALFLGHKMMPLTFFPVIICDGIIYSSSWNRCIQLRYANVLPIFYSSLFRLEKEFILLRFVIFPNKTINPSRNFFYHLSKLVIQCKHATINFALSNTNESDLYAFLYLPSFATLNEPTAILIRNYSEINFHLSIPYLTLFLW